MPSIPGDLEGSSALNTSNSEMVMSIRVEKASISVSGRTGCYVIL